MTNTETLTLSAKEQRAQWLIEMAELVGDGHRRSGEWLYILERIRVEGPDLARPDYEEWQRRFRWISKQILRQMDLSWIVTRVLVDLGYVNR